MMVAKHRCDQESTSAWFQTPSPLQAPSTPPPPTLSAAKSFGGFLPSRFRAATPTRKLMNYYEVID